MKSLLRHPWLPVYLFAAALPPLMVGLLFNLATWTQTLFPHESAPLENPLTPQMTANPVDHPGRPNVLILMSNRSTQISDLLVPYAVFGSVDKFDVFTVAPQKKISPTTGALAIYPDFARADAPPADIIVVPANLDHQNSVWAEWLRELKKQSPLPKIVLSVCEGARLVAASGIGDGRRMTSHIASAEDMRSKLPGPLWTFKERIAVDRLNEYRHDQYLISTAGITGALDGSLKALELWGGRELMDQSLVAFGSLDTWKSWNQPARREPPHTRDFITLMLHGGFSWMKQTVGVWLESGVDELALASYLDVLPRGFSLQVASVAPKREIIRTRYGLQILPQLSFESDKPELDHWLVAPFPPERNSLASRELPKGWIAAQLPSLEYYTHAIASLASLSGSWSAQAAARLLEHPPAMTESAQLAQYSSGIGKLLFHAFLTSLAGLAIANAFHRRHRRRLRAAA